MIVGVKVKDLRVVPDERGRLMEILRNDDDMFTKFGQVYMSATSPGVVKGWHLHTIQEDNITCVKGMLKLVLFDGRDDSSTKGEINEFFIGEYKPQIIHVPANVYHGWKCTSDTEALVINVVTEPYHYKKPDQTNLPPHNSSIPYNWALVEK
jgi:dTDP-4-dehydrorhamnose 3,5-epimerase